MEIESLKGLRIASIHYPTWVDYFDWSHEVIDEGSRYTINRTYVIEKNKVASVNKEGNKISIEMKNGLCIVLILKE